jgi:hypothetical protein
MKRIMSPITLSASASVALVALSLAGALIARTNLASAAPMASIPAPIIDGLQSRYRITIRESAPIASAPVSADQAIAVAQQNFGWTKAEGATAHFVAFTDLNSGTVSPHPNGVIDHATVVPWFVDTPAWLVVMSNAKVPLLGGAGGATKFYTTNLCVFVNPETSAYLKAVTVTAESGTTQVPRRAQQGRGHAAATLRPSLASRER